MSSSRGIFSTQGLNPCLCVSYTAGWFFTDEPPRKPICNYREVLFSSTK